MLESFDSVKGFTYKKLSPEEMKARGILGRLVGPCADFIHPTRNGRKYDESLWQKIFDSDIMKEKIENKVCFGELEHPESRTQIDPTKAAICLAEIPKKGKDGKLYACFDILSTPSGQILKTLCDYGTKIGISSRGQGDTITDFDGTETVDEDTYQCECFDAVLIPAVKEARLTYVTESLNNGKTLKESLDDLVKNSSETDKQEMKEKIKELGLDTKAERPLDIKEDTTKKEADDNGSKVVKDLQEALKKNNILEKRLIALQEKLSVSNAKEMKYEEKLNNYRNKIQDFSIVGKSVSDLESNVKDLQEQLRIKDAKINRGQKIIEALNSRIDRENDKQRSLQESINEGLSETNRTKRKLNSLKEDYEQRLSSKDSEIQELNEALVEAKKDLEILKSRSEEKSSKSQTLVEQYRKTAQKAVSKYIDLQATRIGVSSNEIRSRLNEHYSFNDIDRICEDLQGYKVNMSKLPFNISENNEPKIKIKQIKESLLPVNEDDEIDEQLLKLAGL